MRVLVCNAEAQPSGCCRCWWSGPGAQIQDWDNFGEWVNGQPQPEGVCTAPQPRANLVQLHVRQLELIEDALMEGCAMRAARLSQVLIVAERWPNTRTAAATSSPSVSAASTSATRWDAVLRRYSGVTQRIPATGTEGGLAGLTPAGLDTFSLAVHTVTKQSLDLRVGNLIVRERTIWAGESLEKGST
jgi:hypothetical protein